MSVKFYADSPFYQNYVNSIYALDVAIENYFAEFYLKNEYTRVIYATNAYAMRKRAARSKTNTLDFPFMNFHLSNIEYSSNYNLYHMGMACNGVEFAQYGGYVRPIVATFSYEATFFFERWDDATFLQSELVWDDALISRLFPVVKVQVSPTVSFNLQYAGIINFKPQLDPEYHENEWLEKNKIHTIACDITIESFLFVHSDFGICMPDEILFNFASNHGTPTKDLDEAHKLLVDHLTETVEEEVPP